ncbi:hypothetical protein SAY87_006816 [Trapa incisa]|uniref:Uncharacterized protein n=1 Tax=Trapa incisa TaxID=236973 RepID=A0AAN7K1U1_9MYRT|nr:hypothetical protein SAY87_006816 [Trapa incisa]
MVHHHSKSTATYKPYPLGPTLLPLAAASHLQLQNHHQLKPEVELSYARPSPIPPTSLIHQSAALSIQLPFSQPSGSNYSYPRPFLPEYTYHWDLHQYACFHQLLDVLPGALGDDAVFVGEGIMSGKF